MVSTFAVTGTGAVILAGTEELLERREALGLEPPSFVDVARYVFSGKLEIADEPAAFGYDSAAPPPAEALPLDP